MQQFYNDNTYLGLLETEYTSENYSVGTLLNYKYGVAEIIGRVIGRKGYYFLKFTDKECVGIFSITSISKKSISCPNDKTLMGIGYLGLFNEKVSKDRKTYFAWSSMISRCYSKNIDSYKNVTVCDEWHCYANFKNWFDENYIKGFDLDKDLLQQEIENKVYSPETCIFLPHKINAFLANKKSNNTTGAIGVSFIKRDNLFQAKIRDFDTNKIIGIKQGKDFEYIKSLYIKERLNQVNKAKQYMRNLGYWNDNIIELIK